MAIDINIPSQVKTYANLAAFPATGSLKTIFIAEDTNKTYRWTGTAYVEVSAAGASGITIGTTPIVSGTVGRVLFEGTGNVVQESANLFWDNTNGTLEGTTTADNLFGLRLISTTGQLRVKPYLNPTYGVLLESKTANGSANLPLTLSGSRLLLLDGNVLINTTTDAGFKLDVNGTARINTLNFGLGAGQVATNTAIGFESLITNTTGLQNTFIGYQSGKFSTGSRNTGVGSYALNVNSTGDENSALGRFSLGLNTTGSQNSAFGEFSAYSNTSGSGNTAVGKSALFTNQVGTSNVAIGFESLRANTANSNTAVGHSALKANTTGLGNVAFGFSSLQANTTSAYNTALGYQSLYANITGANNVGIGYRAGWFIADGSTSATIVDNSVLLGYNTKVLANNQTNQIVIGHDATGAGSNTATFGNTSIVDTILRGRINLQQYATGSRPTYVKGALIYDSTLSKLVVGGASGWEVVTSI